MTHADARPITDACAPRPAAHVVVPGDYLTPAMTTRVRREVARQLPRGWFRVRHIRDFDGGAEQSHAALDSVAGASVGRFEIWGSNGRLELHHWPAGGYADDVVLVGSYPDPRRAVDGALTTINGVLTSWGLPQLPACPAA